MLGTACNISRAGFLLLVLVEEDHLAFQSFSGHFSHFTSDSFGLSTTLYVIIGEFLTKLFQELSASSLKDQSGFSDIQIINVATPATSNILKKEDHWPSIVFSSARKDCSQVVHVVYRGTSSQVIQYRASLYSLNIAVTAKNIFFIDIVLV